MTLVTRDENGEGELMGCACFQREMGRRRGAPRCRRQTTQQIVCMVAGEALGGGWHLEVKDDQRKLGRWPECVVVLNC
jgi:hypothetical protein